MAFQMACILYMLGILSTQAIIAGNISDLKIKLLLLEHN